MFSVLFVKYRIYYYWKTRIEKIIKLEQQMII